MKQSPIWKHRRKRPSVRYIALFYRRYPDGSPGGFRDAGGQEWLAISLDGFATDTVVKGPGFGGSVPKTLPHLFYCFERWGMTSRHVIASIDGMVAILVNLISKGYRYYFTGTIDDSAKRAVRDCRMLEYYDADLPKWTRERRRQHGEANFRYLRLDNWFIVLATEGTATRFWKEDRHRIRDVRNIPIRFKGYSISFRQGGYQSVRP